MDAGDVLFGRYRITRWIARGGMGEVFEAFDQTLEQTVALKHVSFALLAGDEAERARARTLREARLSARLRGHPQVVAVYDVLEDDVAPGVWLVLEYLPSRNLSEVLGDHGPLPPDRAARIGASVAAALASAHDVGVLHRDVKPGNVLLGADQVVKLTDFGISRAAGDPAGRVTRTDVVSGTPSYMAPEVARGDEPVPASDVYALGATLYCAVEGHPPFGTDMNALALMHRIATQPCRPPQRAGALAPLVMRLLDPDVAARPTARQARQLLDEFADRPSDAPIGGPATPTAAPAPVSAPPAREPARPRRRPGGLTALVVAAIVLVIGAVTAAVLITLTPSSGSTVPPGSAPLAITGPPAQADACPLFDPASLSRFGAVAEVGTGNLPTGCRALITTPQGSMRVGLFFEDADTPLPARATRTPTGPVTLIREPARAEAGKGVNCPRVIVLGDGSRVGVTVTSQDGMNIPACQITDAAAQDAVAALTAHGITYDPARTAGFSFAGTDACGLLSDQELARDLPGGPPARNPTSGFAGWSCRWNSTTAGLGIDFRLDGNPPSDWGTPTRVAGRQAFSQASGHVCDVHVLHRPWSGPDRPAELTEVELNVPSEPGSSICGAALDLASAADSRVP